MKHLPSFSALRAFEAVARFGSFKDAAASLDLSTSAISHQIRLLEKELGEPLFERRTSGVVLTPNAEQYLKHVRASFDQLEKGAQVFKMKQRTGALRISLLSTLSTLWLIPKLDAFHHRHPQINIELIDSNELVDFQQSRVDAAIRYDFLGKGEWRDLVAHPLIEEYVFPVCSPGYLKEHTDIVRCTWNERHHLLVNSRHPDEWDRWCEAAGVEFRIADHPSHTFMDTSNMTLVAARSGLGVALGRTPFTDRYLDDGELVRFHDTAQHRGSRHFFVYPAEHADKPDLIRFRDWIVDVAAQCNAHYAKTLVNPCKCKD